MALKHFVLRRFLLSIPLIFGAIIMNFMIIHLAPGDPVYLIIGEGAPTEYYEIAKKTFGLDKSLPEQLILYIYRVVQGDFGYSITFGEPVTKIIFEALPATLLLMGSGLVLAAGLGIILGAFSARNPHSKLDYLISTISLSGYSIPTFWLGQLLALVLGLYLGWFPIQGMTTARIRYTAIDINYVIDVLHHLALPVITVGNFFFALFTRLTRSNILEVMREDYILTARSKGASLNSVVFRHALKNAILPVITVLGMNLGFMFAGAILTETVFAWPGIGRLMVLSVYRRDYPMLMGVFVMISIAIIISNLATDLLYGVLDPRIRYK